MQVLNKCDIDFNKLEQLSSLRTTESELHFGEDYIYKMFYNLLSAQRKRKKLILLNEGENLPNCVIPDKLIVDGLLTSGCAMRRIKDSHTLIKYKDSDIFLLLLYSVSLSLKKIHNDPRNIVIGDLHFNNILIDKNKMHHFIDLDSCMIDNMPADRLPNALKYYVLNRSNFKFEVSKETDKLCLLLAALGAIFGKNIDSLNIEEYDEKAEQIYTLKNLRNLVLSVKNNSGGIPDVPYLDEVISINDFPVFKKIRAKTINYEKYQ